MVLIDNLLYILFAEKFKAKMKANIFLFKTLIFFMVYLSQKLCLYLIFKLLERAHV